jgi:ribose transport system permease protein
MTSASNLASMSRNFTPLMGTFFGLAFRKYGHPIVAIVIGEIIISMMFNGFVALGAPITIQNVITGIALLMIVTMTTKPVKGLVVK